MRSEDELQQQLETLYPRIERSIRAYTAGTGLDAEDLAQETFLKAVSSLTAFGGASSVYTWVFRIARNTCIDAMRRLRTRRRYETGTEEDFSGFASSAENESDEIEKRESVSMLRNAIQSLPETYRELIIFKDLEGMSYQEISEVLGLQQGTVKSRLFRARVLLKQALIKAGYEHET